MRSYAKFQPDQQTRFCAIPEKLMGGGCINPPPVPARVLIAPFSPPTTSGMNQPSHGEGDAAPTSFFLRWMLYRAAERDKILHFLLYFIFITSSLIGQQLHDAWCIICSPTICLHIHVFSIIYLKTRNNRQLLTIFLPSDFCLFDFLPFNIYLTFCRFDFWLLTFIHFDFLHFDFYLLWLSAFDFLLLNFIRFDFFVFDFSPFDFLLLWILTFDFLTFWLIYISTFFYLLLSLLTFCIWLFVFRLFVFWLFVRLPLSRTTEAHK